MTIELVLARSVLAIRHCLVVAHGGFWRASMRDDPDAPRARAARSR